MTHRSFLPAVGLLLMLPGCRISPLTNQIAVGEEAFVVMVGDGTGGAGDLYAGSAAGGTLFQLTFTNTAEGMPRLDPTGGLLAFLRDDAKGRSWLVVMNLFNAAEREVQLPPEAGSVTDLGWDADGTMLYLRTDSGHYRTPAPPAALALQSIVEEAEVMAADSAVAVMLGSPAFARVVPCPDQGLCIQTDSIVAPLVADGRDPLRWTSDSVGYLVDQFLVVRPLGPGRSRRIEWSDPPAGLRSPTHFQPSPEE